MKQAIRRVSRGGNSRESGLGNSETEGDSGPGHESENTETEHDHDSSPASLSSGDRPRSKNSEPRQLRTRSEGGRWRVGSEWEKSARSGNTTVSSRSGDINAERHDPLSLLPWSVSPIERGTSAAQTPPCVSRSLSLVHPSVRAKMTELWVSMPAKDVCVCGCACTCRLIPLTFTLALSSLPPPVVHCEASKGCECLHAGTRAQRACLSLCSFART